MPTISIRGYKILQYYNVLFLECAPGDELLSKLLSAEKLIITEHPQNSLLHYSCSSAIIYSGDAAGVCMRIFYRKGSQQQPSCAFPQSPTLSSVTPGEESLCGMVVFYYKVTLSQISVCMLFFPLFLFNFGIEMQWIYRHRYTKGSRWTQFFHMIWWSGSSFVMTLAKKWPMACPKCCQGPQLLISVWDYSLSKHIPPSNGFFSALFLLYIAWNTQSEHSLWRNRFLIIIFFHSNISVRLVPYFLDYSS